jgi:hypothetical protein
MNSYELSRNFFDWSFENPHKVTPNHIALYFFCIEHCNRLGWKQNFGLPTTMAKEAIGIRSYNTYIKTLNDLVDFGFIIMIEKSKNQYSSNIIALSNFNKAHDKALDKALDKAMIKHMIKQDESTVQSIDSINKHKTINNKQITIIEVEDYFIENGYRKDVAEKFYNYYNVSDWKDAKGNKVKNWKQKAQSVWFKDENKIGKKKYDPTDPRQNHY